MANNNSRQFLRVVGEAVEVVTERVERVVRLSDLLEKSALERGTMTPVLPTGCKLFLSQGTRTVFVIEQPPAVRNVVWKGMNSGREKWKLAFPYTIFVVVFFGDGVDSSSRIFFRNTPLRTATDEVFRPNLANTYVNGQICTGDVRVSGQSLAEKAESYMVNFWKSEFNLDLVQNNFGPISEKNSSLRDLTTWETNSMINPLFPLSIGWLKYATLREVVEGGK